jgi:hypothetical protein
MRPIDSAALTIDKESTGITIDPDQVNNKGQAEYQWQAGETATAGLYYIWFKVTTSGGKPVTYPDQATQGRAVVEIFDN